MLQGIEASDWPHIKQVSPLGSRCALPAFPSKAGLPQVVAEVHQVGTRLAEVQALLEHQGFDRIIVEQHGEGQAPSAMIYAERTKPLGSKFVEAIPTVDLGAAP